VRVPGGRAAMAWHLLMSRAASASWAVRRGYYTSPLGMPESPEHLAEELRHPLDQRADDLPGFLTPVDRDQRVEPLGIEAVRGGDELDAVAVRVVVGRRL